MKLVHRHSRAVTGYSLQFEKSLLDFAWATRTCWNHNLHLNMRTTVYFGLEKLYDRDDGNYAWTFTVGKFKVSYLWLHDEK